MGGMWVTDVGEEEGGFRNHNTDGSRTGSDGSQRRCGRSRERPSAMETGRRAVGGLFGGARGQRSESNPGGCEESIRRTSPLREEPLTGSDL